MDDLQGKATDLVKKILSVGVGALFLTEESLRNLVSELKIPKELLTGVLDSATKTRKEFLGKLSSDVLDRVMNKVDPKALLMEVLSKHDLDLKVSVSFRPKDEANK